MTTAATSSATGGGGGGSSPGCNPAGSSLAITYQPVKNSDDATKFLASLTLANNDRRCSLDDGWSLAFSFVRRPLATFAEGATGVAARQQLAAQGLEISHANDAASGDSYKLVPTADFAAVGPGQTRTITFDAEFWSISRSDAPQGFTISYGKGRPSWVPAQSLLDPTDPDQTQAFSGDSNQVVTAQSRFAENSALGAAARLSLKESIVPQPLQATRGAGSFDLRSGRTTISFQRGVRQEAAYLKSALQDVLRGDVGLDSAATPDRRAAIRLSVDPTLNVDGKPGADAEGYRLRITGNGVEIVGKDRAGVLYGIQTLRQLIPVAVYEKAAAGRESASITLPRADISDAPLFGYRGMAIDTARHFLSPDSIKKLLDLMSYLKLNKMHFHLTDDEGWRVQIPGLPELTTFASRRTFDPSEADTLHQAMGSTNGLAAGDGIAGKAKSPTAANLGTKPAYQGFEPATLNFVGQGTGQYSVAEFTSLLKYAAARHIDVIPEFDFPAHARAAVLAMEQRYERLIATGDPVRANQYRLIDPDDTSNHVSVQNYTDNLANPCIPGTYNFLTKVVTEVKKMYTQAGAPLTMVNLGGDEPPGPDRWQGSPLCKSNPVTASMNDGELQDYFFQRWHQIGLSVAPRTAGWDDVLTGGTGNLELADFVPLPWQNVWGWGNEQNAYRFANKGVPVILASATNLYMDLAYNKDPNEPGYYWANFVDERRTFEYQPFDLYSLATHDRWGNPFTPPADWEQLTAAGRKNILGIEAQLFAELGMTPEIREYQAFPKLLGIAERAWNQDIPTPGAQMDAAWRTFSNTLGQVTLPLLSFYKPVGVKDVGVNYRIPLPGGQITAGVLSANLRNPGLTIEYSTDGAHWSTYKRPVRVGSEALLRTRSADDRVSRIAPVDVDQWAGGTRYRSGDLVMSEGQLFRAVRGHVAAPGTPPRDAPALWRLLG